MAKRSVVTIGTFDGVHKGHQKIIRLTCDQAASLKSVPVAVTFDRPPRLFFFPSPQASLLTTVDEKKFLLRRSGVGRTLVLHFDKKFAGIRAQDFFDKVLLKKCRARAVVVGYNFGFGRKREGDALFLEKACARRGLGLTIVPPLCDRSVPVSSGRVRELLREGRIREANRLLGYAYFVSGRVVRGDRLGRTLGFPTANLKVPDAKLVPPGVYAVRVFPVRNGRASGRSWKGMCNAGFRPTVAAGGNRRTVEVHLFGFKGSLYGRELRVEFAGKIRDEKKFASLDRLRAALRADRRRALGMLARRPS